MAEEPTGLILHWLRRQLPEADAAWLDDQLDKIGKENSQRALDIALGMIPRRLGKDDLALEAGDLEAAEAARAGWDPSRWSVDVAARVLVLVDYATKFDDEFARKFTDLCRTADVGESVALYCGLPLYGSPEALVNQVIDGLRTNVRSEFEAIAHRNPFPREHFSENAWNNMVLKALFIGVMLDPIQGLDERANPPLARILSDYAHERWAANRPVQAELWRCIGPFAEGGLLDDLARVFETGTPTERKAAALALKSAPDSDGKRALLGKLASLGGALPDDNLDWTGIAAEMLEHSLAITRKLNKEVELKQ